MLIPQEIHFAHHLASNEPTVRRRAIAKLRKWVTAKSSHVMTGFTEESMLQLWKGLFFCMWMTDKPLVQQDVADEISSLIHSFGHPEQALLFIDSFFKTMAHEWFAIDRYRLDKFMMLVRRFFRQSLVFTYLDGWQNERIRSLTAVLCKTVLHPSSRDTPIGLKTHITDIFIQELARIHGSELTSEQSMLFLEPFFKIIVKTPHQVMRKAVRDNIFHIMMDLDTEYPEDDVSGAEKGEEEEEEVAGSESEEENDEEGRLLENSEASVDLPAIPFDYEAIASRFNECSKREMKAANRNVITSLIKKFWYLTRGVNPRKIVDEDSGSDLEITEGHITEAVRRFKKEEERELRKEREELEKLKKSSIQGVGKFGLDTCSGVYEHIAGPTTSESSSDADTESANDEDEVVHRKKMTSKGKLKLRTAEKMKAKKLKMEEISGESSDDSEVDDNKEVEANSAERRRAGKLKKRAAAPSNILEDDDDGILKKEKERLQRLLPKGVSCAKGANAVKGGTKWNKKQNRKKNETDSSVTGDESAQFEQSSLLKQKQMTSEKKCSKISEKMVKKRKRESMESSGDWGGGETRHIGKAKVSNGNVSPERQSTQKSKDSSPSNILEEDDDGILTKENDRLQRLLPKSVSCEEGTDAVGGRTKRKRKRKKNAADILVMRNKIVGNEGSSPLKKKQVSPKSSTISEKAVSRMERMSVESSDDGEMGNSRKTKLSKKDVSADLQPTGKFKNETPSNNLEKNDDEILRKENERLQRLLPEGVSCEGIGTAGGATKRKRKRNRKKNATDVSVIGNISAQIQESLPLKKKRVALETRVSTVIEEMKKKQNAAKQKKPQRPVSSGRRVNFILSKNQAQDPKDYLESLKASPQIPFSASKRPAQGVLKMRDVSKGSTPNRAPMHHQ